MLQNGMAVQLVKKFNTSMEFECSFLCSQQPTIGPRSIAFLGGSAVVGFAVKGLTKSIIGVH
jgi:hypothetical protein